MAFGSLAELGRRIGRSLIDATQAGSTKAFEVNRDAAQFVREVHATTQGADRAGEDLLSKSTFLDNDSGALSARAESAPVSRQLTDRDVEVIHEITKGDGNYWRINRGLRAGNLTAADRVFVADLRAALAKLRSYHGTVFRDISLSPEEIARYQRGRVITEPAFTSTSRGSRSILGGNVRFKMKSRTGKRVGRYSAKPHEKEVLFPPGTRFEVTGVKYNRYMCRTEIKMTEV
ncbi:ADP-ribosyltransferase domain-containing protein [Nocardia sp. alder85J]|uniref:ADP-ribosyltransferase domain-containing protein n=1 Tax=Nocardia sp. alder85J TaxID=2862949 RepID=UPI001CD22005|nr:ADP-ribosyltransferase domain-containing protein [Nocardia sp. alder85J]MCX4093007.1 ADP-ribosyltransferase domain-containing protein [Nocardia sp. alder85J]